MATYTINLFNQSSYTKNYVVFNLPPQVNTSGDSSEVYANAWVSYPNVSNGGTELLTTTDDVYAYFGSAPEVLSPSVIVQQGGVAKVDTSTRDSVTFVGSQPPGAFTAVTSGLADTGSFQIVANSDFTPDFNYVFGMAKQTSEGIPAPVASFTAMPNDTFNVIPVVTFYVAEGKYTPGEIIDVKEVSTKAATIDFTGKPQTNAAVIQDANGNWSVTYS